MVKNSKKNKTEIKKTLNNPKKDDKSGYVVAAGLFIGLGIGFLTGNLVGWTCLGLGIGFIAVIFLKKYI